MKKFTRISRKDFLISTFLGISTGVLVWYGSSIFMKLLPLF